MRVEHKKHVSILGDLQGPKIRIGNVKEGVILKKNDEIVFSTKKIDAGDENAVHIGYGLFPKDVKKDEKVLVDDGKLIFEKQT